MLLDYDAEAAVYDRTRGGEPRAAAAATTVLGLVPAGARTLLDIGCGTGIVTAGLAAGREGLRVVGADAAHGMLRKAAERLGPDSAVLADAAQLPCGDAAFDAVTAVWLLHLVDGATARRVVAEAARVLRPGGVFVTTVDKDAAHDVGSDIDAVLAPWRDDHAATDRTDLITAYAAAVGMAPCGEAHFTGHGQGRTPQDAARTLLRGRFASWFLAGRETGGEVARELRGLPEPDRQRPDPAYRVVAFRKGDGAAHQDAAAGAVGLRAAPRTHGAATRTRGSAAPPAAGAAPVRGGAAWAAPADRHRSGAAGCHGFGSAQPGRVRSILLPATMHGTMLYVCWP